MEKNKLAYVKVNVTPTQLIEVIEAFKKMFPSISDVNGSDVLRAISITHDEYYAELGFKKDKNNCNALQAEALQRLIAQVDDPDWPGQIKFNKILPFTQWQVKIIPYIGDRWMEVVGGVIGNRHCESENLLITINCLDRPSEEALKYVIEWMQQHPETIIMSAWSS